MHNRAYPQFQQKYGTYYGSTVGYQIPAPWQAGLSNGSTAGTIIGAFINGWAAHRWGYRPVMIVSLFLMNCFIFLMFFANNIQTLLVGEIFCGITWGVSDYQPRTNAVS